MNKCIFMGRLTKEPVVRYTQNEQGESRAVARYTLAVDRGYKTEGQSADFLSMVAFGKAAEFAERYLRQGTKLVVEARAQSGSYTNKDGNRVYTTDFVIEKQEFAESKRAAEQNENVGGSRPEQMVDSDGFMNIPDGLEEGLPFN